MSEKEPTLDQLQKEFKEMKRILELRSSASVAWHQLTRGIPFFELGVQLGKENSEEAQKLITEIREYLIDNQDRVAQQLQWYSYKRDRRKD